MRYELEELRSQINLEGRKLAVQCEAEGKLRANVEERAAQLEELTAELSELRARKSGAVGELEQLTLRAARLREGGGEGGGTTSPVRAVGYHADAVGASELGLTWGVENQRQMQDLQISW